MSEGAVTLWLRCRRCGATAEYRGTGFWDCMRKAADDGWDALSVRGGYSYCRKCKEAA
jgi:hypothetical protein